MGLDVYLSTPNKTHKPNGTGIFVRENGATREITRDEWDERFPGRVPLAVSSEESETVFSGNITHNLNRMASEAGLYEALWRPDESGIERAEQLVPILRDGIAKLKADPQRFRAFNAENGWGNYEALLRFAEEYLNACETDPQAIVSVSR